MGSNCCKSEEDVTETDTYNQNNYGTTYTCNQNNHEDIFKTRPPCWYRHHCPCPCHRGKGKYIFKIDEVGGHLR